MAFRFQRRIQILPGVILNLSKSGISLTLGPKGLRYNIGPNGQYITAGLPGSGAYFRKKIGDSPFGERGASEQNGSDAPMAEEATVRGRGARAFRRGGDAYFAGDYAAAQEAFAAVVEQGDYAPDGLLMGGLSAYLSDDYERALDLLLACIDASGGAEPTPGSPESLCAQLINPDAMFTIPITRYFSAVFPYSLPVALFLVVEMIQDFGETEDAIAAAQGFLGELQGENERLMQLSIAELMLSIERYDELEQFVIEEVGELTNEDNIALEMMFIWAQVLTRREQYEAAKDVYIRALRKTKDRDPELLKALQYTRADMFERWGKPAEARKYFEKLYALDPSFMDVAERLRE